MPRRRLLTAAPFLPALAVVVLLVPFVAADPVAGFTFSNSPFTDEAWWLANARNLVLLGQWSTDDWNLHLVSPVYSGLQAAALALAGVSLVSARLVVIGSVGLTCLALAIGLRGPFGRGPALAAAAAYGFSPLVLYYGRLAYLEPILALGLSVGGLLVLRRQSGRPLIVGLVAGVVLALAIGTKPTAIPLVLGLLAGVLVVNGRASSWARRWVLAAGCALVAAAVLWIALIWLPNRAEMDVVARILAEVTLPREGGELLFRIFSYAVSNDRALLYSLPLLLGATLGLVLAWLRWASLPLATQRLIGAGGGWLLVGLVVLLVIPYRPNRYFLPLVPALAILTATGLSLLGRWLAEGGRRGLRLPAIGLASAALVLPGLLLHAGWMINARSDMAAVQDQVARTIPAREAVEGAYAPLLAFRAPVVTIVARPQAGVNSGDLYVERGVRWVVIEPNETPAWVPLHRAEWDARQQVLCVPWGSTELCLVHVP